MSAIVKPLQLRDRRLWRDFDWTLLLAALALTSLGVIEIFSSQPESDFWVKQLIWLSLGTVAMFVTMLFDYRRIYNYIPYIYAVGIVMLVAVLLFGKVVNGQRNWINLGSFSLQPSEFVKIAVILALARFLSPIRKGDLPFKDIVIAGAITALPVGLIMLQPDAGTAMTFFPIVIALLFLSGLNLRIVIISVLAALLLIPTGYYFARKYQILKPYQIMRVEAILHPELFEQPEFRRQYGYQTMQSIIAVGSGGVTGTGITKGTQSRLGFLPEHHSDFIASVLAEETGFIGSIFALTLYLFIIIHAIGTAERARDRFGMLMILGFISLFSFHVIINVGMVVGLVPILGITLPLMSYGGSSILSTMMALGLVMNVKLRRFVN
ncbi:MAG: rod shape-determining protein RodA [Acidobacteriota bacterium]